MSRSRSKPDRKPAGKVDADMWREAVAMHNGGLSWARIAPSFGVTGRMLAKRWQYETGQHSKPQRRAVTGSVLEQVLDLRASGELIRDIVKATGFTAFSIHRALRAAREQGDPRAAYREGASGAAGALQTLKPVADEPQVEASPAWLTSRVYLSMRAKVGHAKALEHVTYLARRNARMDAAQSLAGEVRREMRA